MLPLVIEMALNAFSEILFHFTVIIELSDGAEKFHQVIAIIKCLIEKLEAL